jgi:hypothetical protein
LIDDEKKNLFCEFFKGYSIGMMIVDKNGEKIQVRRLKKVGVPSSSSTSSSSSSHRYEPGEKYHNLNVLLTPSVSEGRNIGAATVSSSNIPPHQNHSSSVAGPDAVTYTFSNIPTVFHPIYVKLYQFISFVKSKTTKIQINTSRCIVQLMENNDEIDKNSSNDNNNNNDNLGPDSKMGSGGDLRLKFIRSGMVVVESPLNRTVTFNVAVPNAEMFNFSDLLGSDKGNNNSNVISEGMPPSFPYIRLLQRVDVDGVVRYIVTSVAKKNDIVNIYNNYIIYKSVQKSMYDNNPNDYDSSQVLPPKEVSIPAFQMRLKQGDYIPGWAKKYLMYVSHMRKLCMQALQTIKPAFFPVVLSLKK